MIPYHFFRTYFRNVWQTLRKQSMLLWSILCALGADMRTGEMTLRASSLVYTSLLSIVPLLAVGFSVLKGFGVHNQIQPFLLNMLEPLGTQGKTIADEIIGFVENIKVGVLGSVGLIILFYTVLSMVQKIENALNFTWQVTETRPLARRFSDYLSVIVIGPVLIFGSMSVTSGFLESEPADSMSQITVINAIMAWLVDWASYIVLIVAFAFFYMFIPNTKVRLGSALVGAVSAALIWQMVKWGFSTFILSSANYSAVYAAFATPIIFMIWLFLDWMVILTGSRVAFYHQNFDADSLDKRGFGRWHRDVTIHQFESLGLAVVEQVGRHFQDGNPLPEKRLQTIYPSLKAEIRLLTDRLIKGGFLVRSEASDLLPAYALEEMRVVDILSVLRGRQNDQLGYDKGPTETSTAMRIIEQSEHCVEQSLGGLTVKMLVEESDIRDLFIDSKGIVPP